MPPTWARGLPCGQRKFAQWARWLLARRAWQQITTFLKRAGEIARAKDIVIGIEPLRKQESNIIINSGRRRCDLVHEVGATRTSKMIIDYYHMRVEKEDSDILRTAREHIVISRKSERARGGRSRVDEDSEERRFFDLVKKTGYRGGLSIEGKAPSTRTLPQPRVLPKTLKNLKVLFFQTVLRGAEHLGLSEIAFQWPEGVPFRKFDHDHSSIWLQGPIDGGHHGFRFRKFVIA